MSERRVRRNREFFHCTPRQARAAIRRAAAAGERSVETPSGPAAGRGAWTRRASVLFGVPFCLLCLGITSLLVTLLATQSETLGPAVFVVMASTLLFGADSTAHRPMHAPVDPSGGTPDAYRHRDGACPPARRVRPAWLCRRVRLAAVT